MAAAESTTLLVMAAGMGSRYGGIKQMDPVGPDGEFILDYSVFDAWRAGFTNVVFIVRQDILPALREHFAGKLDGRIKVDFAVQSIDALPEGFQCPADRRKPWGTAHAIWCARNVVKGPFAAINADDFYGRRSFQVLHDYLVSPECGGKSCALAAFDLANTLSENGAVSRGICVLDGDGFLKEVVEHSAIEPDGADARWKDSAGEWHPLPGDSVTSMNLWAFPENVFGEIDRLLRVFLENRISEPGCEFYISTVIGDMIANGGWRVNVLRSPEKWFGMTYSADRPEVLAKIAALTASGEYPPHLWK